MFTKAALTALLRTEFELWEHQVIEMGQIGEWPSKTVKRAYVPQMSFWAPLHHRKGIRHAMVHKGVIANASARWLNISDKYPVATIVIIDIKL